MQNVTIGECHVEPYDVPIALQALCLGFSPQNLSEAKHTYTHIFWHFLIQTYSDVFFLFIFCSAIVIQVALLNTQKRFLGALHQF